MREKSKYILGIETSTAICSIAVINYDTILCERSVNTHNNHEPVLMPLISDVLHESKLALSDMETIAVSTGPGSFTGIRTGISTAKGLALGSKKPLAGIPTLDALSYSAGFYKSKKFRFPAEPVFDIICPLLDAHRGEIYTAFYKPVSNDGIPACEQISSYMLLTIDELIAMIDKNTLFPGNIYSETLTNKLGDKARFILPELDQHRAAAVAYLANRQPKTHNLQLVKPVYIRKSQAEEQSRITFAELKENDLDRIMDIEKQSFPNPWTKSMFINSDASFSVVARLGKKILGYAIAMNIDDQVHMENIAVVRQFRNRAIGTKLLQHIIDISRLRKLRSVTLEVRCSNTPAINLYKKAGFTINGARKKYYKDTGEDALIMSLYL